MSRLSRGILLGAIAGIAGIIASGTPAGLSLEEKFGLEVLFSLRGTRAPPPDVLVVSIDKESADRLDQDPDVANWPRSLHARLVKTLSAKGAAVIAFDVFFEEYGDWEGDLAFAEEMRKANNVVLGKRMQSEAIFLSDWRGRPAGKVRVAREIPPILLLADASVATSPYPLPKIPVKVSRDWTFRDTVEYAPAPTMPVVAFQLYTLPVAGDFLRLLEKAFPSRADAFPHSGEEMIRGHELVGMIRNIREIFETEPLAEKRMLEALDASAVHPLDPKKRRILRSLIHLYGGGRTKYLNFYGPTRTIRTIPYCEVLTLGDGMGPGTVLRAEVAGKAVFVGSSESRQLSQKDGFYTVFTNENGVDLSGVEIAATAFANLVEDMPVRPLPFPWHVATLLAWGLLVGLLSVAFRPAFSIPAVAVLSLLYLAAAEYLFALSGTWYPVVFPLAFQGPLVLIGATAWSYVDLFRQRKRFRSAFEQYLPVEVVDELAEQVSGLHVSTRLVNGICLATDAEHYTTLSESLEPGELADFMNRYYEVVFGPINRYGGMVSNIVGDSMLALWLSSREDIDPMDGACRAALEIAMAMRTFRQSREEMALPTRIGLHAGQILLGNVGASHRFEYRPVGDIVNTATRIEGLNKFLGTRILVSREVCSGVNGFLTRDLGAFLLVGKSKPVLVHELICRLEDSTPRQRDCCARFAQGIEAFQRQSWDDACSRFHETLKTHAGDGPSRFYLDLCARYSRNPPGDAWDGVVRMETK